jgi:hypothetical protein
MQPGELVLMDTTALIEAHNTGCLNALAVAFQVETVEQCVVETQNGHVSRAPARRIDEAALRSLLHAVHPVTDAERAVVAAQGGPALDDGERDLWAHALGRRDPWVLCGPDRASMRFGFKVGHAARLISLEALLVAAGQPLPAALRLHYREAWLADIINRLVVGKL